MNRHVYRPASLALAAVVALPAVGCASTATQARRKDLLEVCGLGLAQIELGAGRHIVVAGPHVPEEVVAALGQLRTVIRLLPTSDRYVVPPGYLVLQSVSIQGTHASFAGTAGPHFKNHSLSCGYTYDLKLVRSADGFWHVSMPISVTMC